MVINLTWSNWIPLDADLLTYQQFITNRPGFYRVRAVGSEFFAYIGQTGRSLRQRTRAELTKHVMRPIESPPWNDPHTAAPLLWAFRHEDGLSFEPPRTELEPMTGWLTADRYANSFSTLGVRSFPPLCVRSFSPLA
jgi:hypothetical protein